MSPLGALRQVVAYLVLLVVTFVICFPLLWALSTYPKSAPDAGWPPLQLPAYRPERLRSALCARHYS